MDEGGQESGPHSGPVPWYEIYIGTTCNIQYRRIHRPVSKVTHSTTQNSGVAGRGGARGGDYGLRNYECFPSSHLPHAKCSPGRESACKMLPWEREIRMRNAPPE